MQRLTQTRLVEAARQLDGEGRALLDLWLQRGLSDSAVAELAGMSMESVRARKLDLVEDMSERLNAAPYEVIAAFAALGHARAAPAAAPDPAAAGAPASPAVEPEAVEPEAVEPEAVEPEAVEPEAVEPEAVEPDVQPPEPPAADEAQPPSRVGVITGRPLPWPGGTSSDTGRRRSLDTNRPRAPEPPAPEPRAPEPPAPDPLPPLPAVRLRRSWRPLAPSAGGDRRSGQA